MGCPSQENLRAHDISRYSMEVLAEDSNALNYGPTEGEQSLRRALLEILPTYFGEATNPEQLLITSGGMQGLDLVAKLFIDPGDAVIVEEPVYANTVSVIKSYQGSILPIPVDIDGMQVEEIPNAVKRSLRKPKLINVIPNFQNPTGNTLSLHRRRRLIEIADQLNLTILEDDPYGLLDFSGNRLPSIRTLSGYSEKVISVQTFSKILAPGLRVGWVAGDASIISKMIDSKQCMDTCSSVLGQRIVARLIKTGFDEHLSSLRHSYQFRRDCMTSALDQELGNVPGIRWNSPKGGFFLWLELPNGLDASRVFPDALAEGVAFVPGSAFASGPMGNSMRLCFAYPQPEQIGMGIKKLAKIIKEKLNEL